MDLLRSFVLEDNRDSLDQNLEIQFRTPVLDILSVQADDLFKIGDITASADLPQTGDTGLDAHSHPVMKIVFFPFVKGRRASPNQTHFALENIPELRKLIERSAADEIAYAPGASLLILLFASDNAGIVIHLEHHAVLHLVLGHQGLFSFLRVHIHASELIHTELLAVFADAFLGKKDRAGRLNIDDRGYKNEDDTGQYTAHNAAQDVDHALEGKLADRDDAQTVGQYLVIADLLDLLSPPAALIEGGETVMDRNAHVEEAVHHIDRILSG